MCHEVFSTFAIVLHVKPQAGCIMALFLHYYNTVRTHQAKVKMACPHAPVMVGSGHAEKGGVL